MQKEKKETSLSNEIIIFLLMFILVMLIIAVSTYDFVPTDIVVPEKIEYKKSAETLEVLQEIEYSNDGDKNADLSFRNNSSISNGAYEITKEDLDMYKKKNLYDSGNSRPFDYVEDIKEQSTNSTTDSSTTNSSNQTSQNNTTTSSTNATTPKTNSGTFFESSTTK